MPKITHRCKRRNRCNDIPVASVAFLAPPRKVSFEDNHHDSDSSSSIASQSPKGSLTVLQEEPAAPRLLSRKPTLVRPKSSLSLVDLAKSYNSEESSHVSTRRPSISAPVSPLLSPQEAEEVTLQPGTPSMPSPSPWGYFVDMVVSPVDETRAQTHHYHDSPCSCCSACRRRRANSPYGDFKRREKKRPLCFVSQQDTPKTTPLPQFPSRFEPRRKHQQLASRLPAFRLTPRNPTEQLIGALDRLQVD